MYSSILTFINDIMYCHRYGGKLVEPAGFKLTEEIGAIATATDPSLTQLWIGESVTIYTTAVISV